MRMPLYYIRYERLKKEETIVEELIKSWLFVFVKFLKMFHKY